MEMKNIHEPCAVKNDENLYKIGMFAAMNHVTVKALRFYEEQGLLAPAYINDENGYRYYTMSQMAVVHQISALKTAGFTLDEIASLNAGSDETAVLLKKKADILGKIAELTRQAAVLDGYLAKKKLKLDTPVLVKSIPEVTVAALQDTIESYDSLFGLMPRLGVLMEDAGLECALPEYCFTNYLEPGYKEEDILVEVCQSVVKPLKGSRILEGGQYSEENDVLYFRHLPEVKAACIFHKGSYSKFPETYEIVLRFVEENGYEIAGAIRENYIDGVWNKDSEEEWLTEIQVPVRLAGE